MVVFLQVLRPCRIFVENSDCFPWVVKLFFWTSIAAFTGLWSQDASGTSEAVGFLYIANDKQ